MRNGTDALTTRAMRLRLALAIAKKTCRCGRMGMWRVYKTRGRVHYVKCVCGATGSIFVEGAGGQKD